MEWLYGLLIGSAFTATVMHLAHVGHLEYLRKDWERKDREVQNIAKAELDKHRQGVAAHLERGNTVDSLDDVPINCSCDWAGDQSFAEAEPRVWHRTMKDPKCDVHGTNDAWLDRQ